MILDKPKINKGQTESNNTRKPISGIRKSHFRFLLFIFLLTFLGIFGVYFAQKNETTEPEKLRFQVLKNKCLRGERLSDEEKTEFCTLMKNNAPEQFVGVDCEALPSKILEQSLSAFISESSACVENIKKKLEARGFIAEKEKTKNDNGWLLNIKKGDKLFLRVRLMHRSSGSPKYRKNKDYFRINLVQKASFFADKNGNPSQNPEDTHIAWETCSDFEHVVFNIVKMYSKP